MKFIQKIGDFLGGNLVSQVGDLVDKFVTTSDEREKLKHAWAALLHKQKADIQRLYNEDRANARDMQKAALAQDDLFSKRFLYYLAGGWSIACIAYVFLVTFTEVVSARTSDTVLGFLMGTVASTIVNYFFGSAMPAASHTNTQKDDTTTS